MSPKEPFSYTTQKAQFAPFLLTNFILCALCFILLIDYLYTILSNLYSEKVESPEEMSPKSKGKQSEGTYFLYNRKGAVCAFSVNQLYSLCFMLYSFD